jgi:hypothetical protein
MDIGRVAQRFPLVARPRPACLPLAQRIQEIESLARAAGADQDLARASAAMNRAALIASDCALPDLARTLCWRHADTYLHAGPLGAREARYALEPLVNLARLAIRDGDGHTGYATLEGLHSGTANGTSAVVDGRTVPLGHLTAGDEDRREVTQWLWTVLLGDATRALVSAGDWERALDHLTRHKGIGVRLLDGRQVTVVAHCLKGEPDRARQLLAESSPVDPWEHLVDAVLGALCAATAGGPADVELRKATNLYRTADIEPNLAVFHTRIGLTAIDLAAATTSPHLVELIHLLLRGAKAAPDAHAAREALQHPHVRNRTSRTDRQGLLDLVEASGLGRGMAPSPLLDRLESAVAMAQDVISRLLCATHDADEHAPARNSITRE